ncbi:MAG TPA: hydroxymethylbilane synthase, partial [Devosia sp.]|nr:hydroxymethylbilane synthase [Devosia sp.]
ATALLDPEIFIPAPAQGAIGLTIRSHDSRSAQLVEPLNHVATHRAIVAERAMLKVLDGSCRTPVGALSKLEGETIILKGQILSLDGQTAFDSIASGTDPLVVGRQVGEDLIAQAGTEWLAQWASNS